MDLNQPHRRWNPLLKQWILVSPHRGERPWLGQVENPKSVVLPQRDSSCALCPGSIRTNGQANPEYTDVFIFTNDFPAVRPNPVDDSALTIASDSIGSSQAATQTTKLHNTIFAQSEQGLCRVICFSPRHDLTLPLLSQSAIVSVIEAWQSEYQDLASRDYVNHVMIFENKGEMMGCSNPHPHGQIWATQSIPNNPLNAASSQIEYYREHGRSLLQDYLSFELDQGERIVCQNDDWVVLVPYWAVWPFETLVLPKQVVSTIAELSSAQKSNWAAVIKELTTRYDNLFETSFPYSMGVYQRPTDGGEWSGFCLRQEFFPPLLRSATIRKFMVGFELCAEPQRDLTAELAAKRLRGCSVRHYLEKATA